MLDKEIIAQLEALAGKKNVLTGTVDRLTYSYDATADLPRMFNRAGIAGLGMIAAVIGSFVFGRRSR